MIEHSLSITLNKFYERICYNTKNKRKNLTSKSLFIEFMNIRSNEVFRLLNESAIKAHEVPSKDIKELLERKFIRSTSTLNNYVITFRGLWEVEKNKNIVNEDVVLNSLDGRIFTSFDTSEKPLRDQEKVILFSLISARAFSIKSSVDLKRGDDVSDVWKDIIDKSYEKLKSLGVISDMDSDKLYGKSGNEHPVSNIFRHAIPLQKKSKGIYKAPGQQKYFLDVSDGEKILNENLIFVFCRIFDKKKLSLKDIDEISEFCSNTAHTKNIYVFESNHVFSRPEFDDVIRSCLLSI